MEWKKAVLLGTASAFFLMGAADTNPERKMSEMRKFRMGSAFVGQRLTVLGGSGTNVVRLPANCEQPGSSDDFYCQDTIRGSTEFGFVSVAGGFAFEITGSQFDDNIVVWTNRMTQRFHFAIEWVDDSARWGLLAGSVDAGDIADEAQDRGLQPGDFRGFVLFAEEGNDQVSADGQGAYGILPGHALRRVRIPHPFYGERLLVDGGTGTNNLDLPSDCVDVGDDTFECFYTSGETPAYGFVAVAGGFAFRIDGTDFDEEFVLWMNRLTGDVNFSIEWQDASLTSKQRVGSIDAGDIADEAQDRGLAPGDFRGFVVRAEGGDDVIRADGLRR